MSQLRAWLGPRPRRRSSRLLSSRLSTAPAPRRTPVATAQNASRPRRCEDRIRVVYLDHVAQLSGGEIALLRLLPHLDRVDAHVILAENGPLVARLHQASISVEVRELAPRTQALRKERIHRGGVPWRAVADVALYVLRLTRHLRRLRPDLVHTNSLKAGVYGSLAGRLAGVPVVWHVHDRISEDYLPRPAVVLVRWMTRRVAHVIANSESTLATLDTERDAVVISSMLPGLRAPPAARTRDPTVAFRCGMVGRIAPWKGQELFLRAFSEAFPDGRETAVVIGAALFGENEYDDALRELVCALALDGRVEFRGFRTDVWAELGGLDILVCASLTPEPFGQVVIEGMAAGVPVIAPNAGGPAEILAHDETGMLFTPGDAGSLARCLRSLRDDPARRDRLVAAAYLEVSKYSPDTVAEEIHDVYARTLERSSRRSAWRGGLDREWLGSDTAMPSRTRR